MDGAELDPTHAQLTAYSAAYTGAWSTQALPPPTLSLLERWELGVSWWGDVELLGVELSMVGMVVGSGIQHLVWSS